MSIRALSWLCLPLLLLLAIPAAATLERFQVDPVHTRIAFQINHSGFSNPVGTFSGSHGLLSFDENDWASAQLDVCIPIASLNLGDTKWQEKILDATFFNAKKFPEACFIATQMKKTGDHSALLTGNLTLHGITQPVTLTVTLNALKRHPLTFKRTAGFSATATISRKSFGMDAWESVVGDEVRLIIEVEATRSHANHSEAADAEPK